MKLRVGLVGLGDYWQSRHRPALRALSDRFDVKAICCEVAEKSKLAANEFSATPMDGFRAMIERDDIDAVLALAPDWAGPLPIIAACEAGKAVYSSAAWDISFDQVHEIHKRVDESGVAHLNVELLTILYGREPMSPTGGRTLCAAQAQRLAEEVGEQS